MISDFNDLLPESSKQLLQTFNLKYPVFQAPAGGPAGEKLAIAVAHAGGMGSLSMTWNSPEHAARAVELMNKSTNGNYFINYVLHFPPKSLPAALDVGVPIVQFSFGIPNKEIVSNIRSAGSKIGIQVTSKINALKALEHDPDFLICQGIEAGGHVQSHHYLEEGLAEVLEISGHKPVLASGGISDGIDLLNFSKKGAAGIVMGSRFLATIESRAHIKYKNALVQAEKGSTINTVCFDKGWPNSPHRVIRNNTSNMWEAEGNPPSGNRAGENDIVAIRTNGVGIERYSTSCPVEGNTGDVLDLALYAGTGVGKITDIPSVDVLLKRIGQEYTEALRTGAIS